MRAIGELEDVFLVGAGADGRVTAVAVFGHTPHGADYLFNISAAGSEHHAVHLVWFAVERLRAMGIARLNLGGGIRLGDDLADFKRRFGADQRPLWSLRQTIALAFMTASAKNPGSAQPTARVFFRRTGRRVEERPYARGRGQRGGRRALAPYTPTIAMYTLSHVSIRRISPVPRRSRRGSGAAVRKLS